MAEADWRPFWGELGSNPQALRTISTHDQHDGVDIQFSELISPQTPVRCAPEHRANLPKHTGCSTILSHTDTDTYTDTQHGHWRERTLTHFETYLNSLSTQTKPRYENKKYIFKWHKQDCFSGFDMQAIRFILLLKIKRHINTPQPLFSRLAAQTYIPKIKCQIPHGMGTIITNVWKESNGISKNVTLRTWLKASKNSALHHISIYKQKVTLNFINILQYFYCIFY